MSVKLKLAGVALAVALSGVVVWRMQDGAGDGTRAAGSGAEAGSPVAAGAADALRAAEGVGASPASRVADAAAPDLLEPPPISLAPSADDVTLLAIQVLDAHGVVQTEGHLEVAWGTTERFDPARSGRFINAPIAGPVTEVRVPARAAEAIVTASIAAEPPSEPVRVDALRHADRVDPPARPVRREVTVTCGSRLAGPILCGAIRVDGELRVPSGLRIRGDGLEDPARVNVLTAQYQLGPFGKAPSEYVWVESDETVPFHRKIEPPTQETALDLDLETGRTLVLTVLERATRAPLAGLELYVQIDIVAERSWTSVLYRDDLRFVTTDGRGVVRVPGLPREGFVHVHRDDVVEPRALDARGGGKMVVNALRDPIWELKLEKKLPATLEQTLFLEGDGRQLRAFGQLPPDLAATGNAAERTDVFCAVLAPDGAVRRADPVTRDAGGAWAVELPADSRVLLWLARDRYRISEIVTIERPQADVGPVEFALRRGSEITLRLRRLPASGRVGWHLSDPALPSGFGSSLTASGGDLERRFPVDGPVDLSVHVDADNGDGRRETTWSRRVRVDPATQAVVEFDLGGVAARTVTLEVAGGSLEPAGRLGFLKSAAAEADGPARDAETAWCLLEQGKSTLPVALAPGRWFFFSDSLVRGLVAGFVDVDGGGEPIRLRVVLEARPRAALGRQALLTTLAGESVAALPAAIRTLAVEKSELLAGAEELLVPSGSVFEKVEE